MLLRHNYIRQKQIGRQVDKWKDKHFPSVARTSKEKKTEVRAKRRKEEIEGKKYGMEEKSGGKRDTMT